MLIKFKYPILLTAVSIGIILFAFQSTADPGFITFSPNLKQQQLQMYWKDDANKGFKSIGNLNNWLKKENKHLIFAMNGGMYKKDNSPQGLYIENKKILSDLDTLSGSGNFYLKPNGVFFITNLNVAGICKTENFGYNNINYATQSGPMLIIGGEIHSAFKEGSHNLNIRNGVGILANGNPVFVMSKEPINFYDFAMYLKSLGCTNALYLDGLVSRTYYPDKNWIQTDGDFGVIIGITD